MTPLALQVFLEASEESQEWLGSLFIYCMECHTYLRNCLISSILNSNNPNANKILVPSHGLSSLPSQQMNNIVHDSSHPFGSCKFFLST